MTVKQAIGTARRTEKTLPAYRVAWRGAGRGMCPDMPRLFGVGRDSVLDAIRPHGVGVIVGKLVDSPWFYEDDDIHRCPVIGIVYVHRGERNALMNIEAVLEAIDIEMGNTVIDRGDSGICGIQQILPAIHRSVSLAPPVDEQDGTRLLSRRLLDVLLVPHVALRMLVPSVLPVYDMR